MFFSHQAVFKQNRTFQNNKQGQQRQLYVICKLLQLKVKFKCFVLMGRLV